MYIIYNKNRPFHPFHMVQPSPWPFFISLNLLFFLLFSVSFFHGFINSFMFIFLSFLNILIIIYNWFCDIVFESIFEGNHTKSVKKGLRLGMILFIISEIMFFFGFFWAFFHSALVPSIFIGTIWPPIGIQINSLGLPFIGTIFLLISGYYYTYSYQEITLGHIQELIQSLIITISFGTTFIIIQFYEYYILPFTISNNIYTCCFFLLTGFHGFHVLIGVIFILIFFYRFYFLEHCMQENSLNFELSLWYWHFVDIVWLFVYLILYWWGVNF